MDTDLIGEIAISLVREYLKRKGLQATYETLSIECPKDESSITNRSELARILQIEKLLIKNKETPSPLRTLLEVIAKYLHEREADKNVPSKNISKPSSSRQRPGSASHHKERKSSTSYHNNQSIVIEDDIESETLIGRGRDDLFDRVIEPEAPEQQRPKTHRKHRNNKNLVQSTGHERRKHRLSSSKKPSSYIAGEEEAEGDSSHMESPVSEPRETTQSQVLPEPRESTPPQPPLEPKEAAANPIDFREVQPQPDSLETREITPPETPVRLQDPSQAGLLEEKSEIGSVDMMDDSDYMPKMETLTSSFTPHSAPIQPSKPQTKEEKQRSDFEKTLAMLKLRRRDRPPEEPIVNILDDSPVLDPATTSPSAEDPITEGEEEEEEKEEIEAYMIKHRATFKSAADVISSAKPIDIQTAMELKRLVLGSASLNYTEEWKYQSFGFCDIPDLLYGIIQHRTGPCGLLAAVQAHFIMELLFRDDPTQNKTMDKTLRPSPDKRERILMNALSKILWKAGEGKRAVLVIPCGKTIISGGGRYKSDGLTETLMMNIFDQYEDLLMCISKFHEYFGPEGNGVLLLLYSVILSRGIELVLDDMDSKETALISPDGHCAQEMINLLLCGKAASNLFNDAMEVNTGGKTTILKGIPNRCDVGFLSTCEHHKTAQVGIFLKTPKYPVWIVYTDDHYSVLFCLVKDLISDWKAERRFDLFYYDSLALQDESIKLSIVTTNRFYEPPAEDDMVSPLELCIRTKEGQTFTYYGGHLSLNCSSKDPADYIYVMNGLRQKESGTR